MESVHRLGTPVATPGFHHTTALFPPETLASWQDREKSFTVFFSITSTTWDIHDSAGTARAAHDAGYATSSTATNSKADTATYDAPQFKIMAVRGDVTPPDTGTVTEALASFGSDAVELACSYRGPEEACCNLFSMQELALALQEDRVHRDPGCAAIAVAADACVAAKAAGDITEAEASVTELRLLQLKENRRLLTTLQGIPACMVQFPRLLFGLSEVKVLTWLEGQEQVEHCATYKYVQVRSCHRFCVLLHSLLCFSCTEVRENLCTVSTLARLNPVVCACLGFSLFHLCLLSATVLLEMSVHAPGTSPCE